MGLPDAGTGVGITFCHSSLEVSGHPLLLVDLTLPLTCSTGITSNQEVGLETKFSLVITAVLWKGRFDFTKISGSSWESCTLEEDFKEDLGVKLYGWSEISR